MEEIMKKKFVFFSAKLLAALNIGPNEGGVQDLHWRQMMEKPGERIFIWHTFDCKDVWLYCCMVIEKVNLNDIWLFFEKKKVIELVLHYNDEVQILYISWLIIATCLWKKEIYKVNW